MQLEKMMNLFLWAIIIVMIVIGFIVCFRKEKQPETPFIAPPLPEDLPPAMTYEKVIQHYTTK